MPISQNKIHQGDCIKLLSQLTPGSIDLVFADPPFNIGYEYDVYDDTRSYDAYLDWSREWIEGVFRAVKDDGTFWLAIGDEFAAELKIVSQKAGFHCRSWVIWYYTFGVNCANGFSRSHTHLFHFVKNPKKFTFVRPNPNIRVKSARQLVYADLRANPTGRLPDNTWITRPQDAPESFRPNHDTWYFSRVAGTFKEREGFHGCQMPEQLLARIIRTSSNPYDLVLDPFGGSGTTLCVAKKLNRSWIGFELSKDYVRHIKKRIKNTEPGDPLDGPADPLESAPATSQGKKRRKTEFDDATIEAVIDAYRSAGEGYPVDYLLSDARLNKEFVRACLKQGLGGNAIVWNRLLLQLRKSGRLPRSTNRPNTVSSQQLGQYGYASEIAWRLISDEFGTASDTISLDDIFCCPDSAAYFDQIALQYGPADQGFTSLEYRRAAFAIRKMAKVARSQASQSFSSWSIKQLSEIKRKDLRSSTQARLLDGAGIYRLMRDDVPVYAGEAANLKEHLIQLLEIPAWERLAITSISVQRTDDELVANCARKSALVSKLLPLLNCRVWQLD